MLAVTVGDDHRSTFDLHPCGAAKTATSIDRSALLRISSMVAEQGPLLDAVIFAQRITPYWIAGFCTAAAYARALRRTVDAEKLHRATQGSYRGDEYASTLAETSNNLKAESA